MYLGHFSILAGYVTGLIFFSVGGSGKYNREANTYIQDIGFGKYFKG